MKIEFVTSIPIFIGRGLIIYTDLPVEDSFEMTFTELSQNLSQGRVQNELFVSNCIKYINDCDLFDFEYLWV